MDSLGRDKDDKGPGHGAEDGSPAVRRLSALLAAAVEAGASDLHLEPDRDGLRVRMRVDGQLHDLDAPPAALVPALLTRVRLLARVDLAERRLPQDGRFTWTVGAAFGATVGAAFGAAGGAAFGAAPSAAGGAAPGAGGAVERIDIRAAFLPVARGEKVALRLLRHPGAAPALGTLGMPPPGLARLADALARPNGLVLVVGPTGSGKSTTLHAALVHLRRGTRSLATVEDPVEFDIPGVSQVAVDDEVGRSFAVVLRALLRQDPDVLMVGEIRDDESARIACRAALTGHLVLSSLHASHAREALLRLPEIGVPDYLVRATVSLVVAQRLVRRLCPACATTGPPLPPEAAPLFHDAGLPAPARLPCAVGCDRCHGRGYRGRLALFETAASIADAPAPFSPGSLGADGLARVAGGDTTLEEVLTHCPRPDELDGCGSGSRGGAVDRSVGGGRP